MKLNSTISLMIQIFLCQHRRMNHGTVHKTRSGKKFRTEMEQKITKMVNNHRRTIQIITDLATIQERELIELLDLHLDQSVPRAPKHLGNKTKNLQGNCEPSNRN